MSKSASFPRGLSTGSLMTTNAATRPSSNREMSRTSRVGPAPLLARHRRPRQVLPSPLDLRRRLQLRKTG